MPLISVIISTLNAEKTLQRSINSFTAQTLREKELIIIDGGSTDGTEGIIRKNAASITHWVSEPDKGIYSAWNKGIRKASGKWIYFLGADDYIHSPDVFSRIAPSLEGAHPASSVVYGRIVLVSTAGNTIDIIGTPWSKAAWLFRHEMSIPHQGVFQHRSLFDKYGCFDENFKICGDYDFLLRDLKSNPAIFIPDLIVAAMQTGGISGTLSKTFTILEELKLARAKNGLGSISPILEWRFFRARTRRLLQKYFGRRISDLVADIYRVFTGRPRLWTRKDIRKNI
ncbi:MAG: hypothetical protein A2583_00760 [Bdellovibrionales bacterium RIFOXYD1_FULL_53_11]|nr:MAG: hypothetical protein A2583_00760 [Bdellovibrionales bacterium RIFOXYD1_FULL_53_11]